MPNKSSKAGHQAERTCVICRAKKTKNLLLGFYLLDNDIVYDMKGSIAVRKRYVCNAEQCLSDMNKWLGSLLKKSAKQKLKQQIR